MRSLIIAVLFVAAAFASPALAQDSLRFPLATVQDSGVPENPTSAAKVRELAQLVIERGRARSLAYNPNKTAGSSDYQGVESVVVIGSQRWTVWVANYNESAEIHLPDKISFWARPDGTSGQDSVLTFSDNGLDGNCDYGSAPADLSNPAGRQLYFDSEETEGLQHRAAFQLRYEGALVELIAYYKQDK